MNIILSAQEFGFGPTTQMFAFIKHLLSSKFTGKISILANPTTDIFYKNFSKYNSTSSIKCVHEMEGSYDTYIGFYDPHIIFKGHKLGAQTIFVCNLTFLWNSKIESKKNLAVQNIKSHHDAIYTAYQLASNVFIRSSDGISKSSILYKTISHKMKLIGPIIYPKLYTGTKKKHILIPLGGQVNPLSTQDFYKKYLGVINLISSSIEYDLPITYIVHPKLRALAKKTFTSGSIISTTAQEEYQKLLAEASHIFSPFGINTFFESTYYSVPTYILPEQHLGHAKSIRKYFSEVPNQLDKQSYLISQFDDYLLDHKSEKKFIDYLERKYKVLLTEQNKVDNIDYFLKSGVNLFKDIGMDKIINKNIDLLLQKCM